MFDSEKYREAMIKASDLLRVLSTEPYGERASEVNIYITIDHDVPQLRIEKNYFLTEETLSLLRHTR